MDFSLIAKQTQVKTALAFKKTLILLLVILASACSSTPDKIEQRSEEEYFQNAQKAIRSGNYITAIEQLLALDSRFPFGRYTAQAQLELIYAYYQSLEYDKARATARRFIRLNPDHPDVDYAHYMEALAAYDIDRGFLARILPSSPAERDLYPLYDTFTLLKRFTLEFPESEFYQDAKQRMVYIRNLLAEHEIYVGNFYMKRGAYLAAIKRGQYVVEHFPNTPWVEQGLVLMVQGYRKLGMTELENSTREMITLNYPEQEKGKSQPENKTKPSWLKALTFWQ